MEEKGDAVPLLVKKELQTLLMKAHKLEHEDHDLTFPLEKMAPLRNVIGRLQPENPLAQRDIEVVRNSLEHLKIRNERIEALKMQVNAGTYQMDSTSIAQKMIGSHLTREILYTGRYNTPVFIDEE